VDSVNYYERHLGDYARDAGHLSMLEHGAYCLLLDRYYITEQGIPADQAHRLCRARSKEERGAVDAVLAEFFTLDGAVWTNSRAAREVIKARTKIEAARQNGKGGGRPKRTQPEPTGLLPGLDSITQDKALQTPDTKLNHSEANASGGPPPTDGEFGDDLDDVLPPPTKPAANKKQPDDRDMVFAVGVVLLTAAGVKESNARSFLALQSKTHGDAAVVRALQACAEAKPVQPVAWLQANLKPKTSTRHSGFDKLNYREGVNADGTFA
jgi:uncharacterized protein YdaU (DUF1376 family)